MGLAWVVLLAASLAAGVRMWHLAPARWGLGMMQGAILGSSLYFAGLHRFVMRESAAARGTPWLRRKGVAAGLLWRALLFLGLAAIQAAVCFEWLPRLDVRFAYVIAATWLFAFALIDAPSKAREEARGS